MLSHVNAVLETFEKEQRGKGKGSSYLVICHLCHACSFIHMYPHSHTLTALREEEGAGRRKKGGAA